MDDQATNSSGYIWAPSLGRAVLAGLIGGLAGFALLQMFYPFFEKTILQELTTNPSDEQVANFIKAHTDFYSRNFAVGLAIWGACLGIFFTGLTVPQKRVPSALLAGVLGAVGAGIAGYFAGQVTGVDMAWSKDQVMTKQALITFAIWGAMTLGIAFGASVLQGDFGAVLNASVVAVIAAIIVVFAIILVFAIIFPAANLSNYIPTASSTDTSDGVAGSALAERLTWSLVASLVFSATMAMGLKPKPAKLSAEVSDPLDAPASNDS